MSNELDVLIAVCSYRRPQALCELLASLHRDHLVHPSVRSVQLLVVDNDEAGTAAPVVDAAAATLRVPIRYLSEPRRGLVAARNRAIEASDDADLLAFLDDDEVVRPGWFCALMDARTKSDAVFVIGPVRPTYPEDAPAAVRRSGLFERHEYPDLRPLQTGNTGNALIDLRFLRAHAIKFREDFNRSGGEDDALFREIRAYGGPGVYAAKAIVEEPVSRERMRLGWLLWRRVRFGATEILRERTSGRLTPWRRIGYGANGVARLMVGGSLGVVVWPVMPHRALRYLAAAARGLGYCLGGLGLNVREY